MQFKVRTDLKTMGRIIEHIDDALLAVDSIQETHDILFMTNDVKLSSA